MGKLAEDLVNAQDLAGFLNDLVEGKSQGTFKGYIEGDFFTNCGHA